jgi:DNA-binding transcriptional LysR family regulator
LPRGEGLEVIPLGEETVTPLCVSQIAKRIRQPKDLLSQVLIRSDVKQVQWHQWFTANGLEPPAIHGMRFDRSFLAIAMACGGVGVTLESTRLAEREIESGRLIAPLAGRSTDIRYVGHHLVFPRAGSQRRALRFYMEGSANGVPAGNDTRTGSPGVTRPPEVTTAITPHLKGGLVISDETTNRFSPG